MRLPSCLILTLMPLTFAAGVEPRFEAQTIDDKIEIGYGLAIGDVDGDGKPDILLADKREFVWYRNPGGTPGSRPAWERHVMVKNLTLRDNVCLAARDLDGDGQVEIAVGANWNPGETSDIKESGSVHLLVRPPDPATRWEAIALPHDPTVHRMRWVNWGEGDSRHSLVVVPLHGIGNKKGAGENGVRVYAYDVPEDPEKWGDAAAWERRLLDESMHVTHNLDVQDDEIVVGGAEGIIRRAVNPKAPQRRGFEIGPANSTPPTEGVGEIRINAQGQYATVEPFHGNMLAVYEEAGTTGSWKRTLLDDSLVEGHALAWGDVLGLGSQQVLVGWRRPDAEAKVGIKVFYREGQGWKSALIDDNTMACEDLRVADLDGDGRDEVVAAGRATLNLAIYWNAAGG